MREKPTARTQDLILEELDDELVVYDKRTTIAHALSSDAAAVWRICDGELTVPQLGERLGLEPAVVERALEALRESELLEEPSRPGYSRRQAVARMAVAGSAAFLTPFVYSVSIASAANGCPSCKTQGTIPNGTDLGKDTNVPTCTNIGGSGTKGCDCNCVSGTCYEGKAGEVYCVSAICIPGGMSAGGDCSKCCAGVCNSSGVTCSACGPGQTGNGCP